MELEFGVVDFPVYPRREYHDKRWWWIAAGCVFLLWLLAAECSAAAGWLSVKWVDDGDTILLTDGRRVRYIGINAPEVAHAKYGRAAEPFGDRARAANQELVYGKKIRLEWDRELKDHYGRLLAYVYLEDGRCVNQEMIAAGWAYVLYKKPNDRCDRILIETQRRAMKAGLGIWSRWHDDGETIVGNRRSRRFHLERCPESKKIHPKNRRRLASQWEAYWQGYAPSKKCGP
ncbi:MAG: thermonuclease family protein [Desulfobacterales bacterium]